MMIKSFLLSVLVVFGSGLAQAQPELMPFVEKVARDPEQEVQQQDIALLGEGRPLVKVPFVIRRAPVRMQLQLPLQPAMRTPVKQVVDLGDVVVNVVIAKVLTDGTEPELIVAKFGGKEANAARSVSTTSFRVEQRTRKVIVGDQQIEQTYTVNVPVTTSVNQKQNFTPTEQNRSISVSNVQAFDLKGNPVDASEWMKRLETPQHVLLLSSPITEANKLNSLYASILQEDLLMLFLGQQKPGKERERDTESLTTEVYRVNGLPVWKKDGEAANPNEFIQLLQSRVTPNAWQGEAKIVEFRASQSLLITANALTHEGVRAFLFKQREELARLQK